MVLAAVAVFAGCGTAGDGNGGDVYAQMLSGLDDAASEERAYGAVRRAAALEPAEQHVLEAFCDFASQIIVNREAWKLPEHRYVMSRIRTSAYRRGGAYSSEIRAALRELDDMVDISSLKAADLARYADACR